MSLFFIHCEKEEFFKALSRDKGKVLSISPADIDENYDTHVLVDRKALFKHLFYRELFSDIQIEYKKTKDHSGYMINGITPEHIFRKIFQAEAGDMFLTLGGYSLEDKSGISSGLRTLFSNLDFIYITILRKDGNKETFKLAYKKEEKRNPTQSFWDKELRVILTNTEYSSFREELSGYEFKEESGKNGFLIPETKNEDISYMIGLLPGDIIHILDETKLEEPHSLNKFFKKEVTTRINFSVLRDKKELIFEIIAFPESRTIENAETEEPTQKKEESENIFKEKMENENE